MFSWNSTHSPRTQTKYPDLQPHTVTTATHDDDDTGVVTDEETYETQLNARLLPLQSGRPPHSDEDWNLIKKGWDQLYRDPMREEGFLSRAREARAGWQEAHKEAKRKARDEAVKDYIAIHDTLDGFDMDKD